MTAGLLVVAKAPIAGFAKTRLAATVGKHAAARMAAAALLDTLDAGEVAAEPGRRLVALSGELAQAARAYELRDRLLGWQVVGQRGDGLAQRLAHAHADAAELWGDDVAVVQIGADTPQVTPADLARLADVVTARDGLFDASIGPAVDGGWWALATRRAGWATALRTVAMSDPDTGRLTSEALADAGARVCELHLLRDVDTSDDAAVVASLAPHTRFAQAWADCLSGAVR